MFAPATRILVVDDMIAMRVLIKNQLRPLGFSQFTDAENGKDAFALLQQRVKEHAPIELILSDWNMPEMKGIDFLKKVRATPEFKDLPFLMITAEGEIDQVREAIAAGVSNYVIKPFTPATIKEKLTAVWQKHGGKNAA